MLVSRRKRRLYAEPLESRCLLATLTVTSSGDGGPGSLREALDVSNTTPGVDLIEFAVSEVRLALGQLVITDPVTIDGSALSDVTITAEDLNVDPSVLGGGTRVFVVDIAGTFSSPVTFRQLSIEGGNVSGFGGGIYSNHDVVLERVSLLGNSASADGGGIQVRDANLDITLTTIANNESGESGGGVLFDADGDYRFEMRDSIVSGNRALQVGGGAEITGREATSVAISRTLFTANVSRFNSALDAYIRGAASSGLIEFIQVSENTTEDLPGYTSDSGALSVTANQSAQFDVRNTTIANNVSGSTGGASFFARYSAVVHAEDLLIANNEATRIGGGVHLSSYGDADVILESSIVTGNSAAFRGGGIVAYQLSYLPTRVEIVDTLVTDNVAGYEGGGIWASTLGIYAGTQVLVNNSTVSGNSSSRVGGGVYIQSTYEPSVRIQNTTVAFNESANGGGGVATSPFGEVELRSSLLADNTTNGGPDDLANHGTVVASFTLVETISAGPTLGGATNIVGVDAHLLPLADNGGATMTHALAGDSSAIDAGIVFASTPAFDQRGEPFDRVRGAAADMGAYESQMALLGDFNGDGLFDCDDINMLTTEVAAGTNSVGFDLTDDGFVDQEDTTEWLSIAGATNLTTGNPYLEGDANLDGIVDGNDFITWNDNKFGNSTNWCDGNFDGNDVVDGLDFIIWNGNRFMSSDTTWIVPNQREEFVLAAQAKPIVVAAPEQVTLELPEGPRTLTYIPLETAVEVYRSQRLVELSTPHDLEDEEADARDWVLAAWLG